MSALDNLPPNCGRHGQPLSVAWRQAQGEKFSSCYRKEIIRVKSHNYEKIPISTTVQHETAIVCQSLSIKLSLARVATFDEFYELLQHTIDPIKVVMK